MAKKKKQTFTVHYSINGAYDIDVEAENAEEAINLADDTFDANGKWIKYAAIEPEAFQVEDENGNVVWGMS